MPDKLHASASWPQFNCPASKTESDKAAGSTCKPARDGQQDHRLVAKHFNGDKITWPAEMSKEQREQKWRFDSALYIHEELSEWLVGEPLIEYTMDDDPDITGTLDFESLCEMPYPNTELFLLIIDWKGGYIRDFENALCQLKTYAGLRIEAMRRTGLMPIKKIYLYAGWLRDREYESDPGHPFTVEEIDAHMATLRANLKNPDVYVTGEHCACCGGRSGCKANASRVTALIKRDPSEPIQMTPELAIWTQGVLPSARRAIKDAEEALRNYVEGIEEQGGEVVHDGRRLTIGPGTEAKRYVHHGDNEVYHAVLDYVDVEKFNAAAIVPFGALKEIVMNEAERGKKGKTVRAFEEMLDKKGLIVKSKRRGSLKLEKADGQ